MAQPRDHVAALRFQLGLTGTFGPLQRRLLLHRRDPASDDQPEDQRDKR